MFKKMLVATDGSALATQGLEVAATLARALQGEIDVLTVTEESVADAFEELEQIKARHAANVLQKARERASELGVQCRVQHLPRREVASGLTDFAREHGNDLIVIASHGAGGFERLLMGSRAKRLLTVAGIPVLVVRGPGGIAPKPSRYDHLLVAFDGSDHARGALDMAVGLAHALGSRLTIVAVSEPEAMELPAVNPSEGTLEAMGASEEAIAARAAQKAAAAKRMLAHAKAVATQAGVDCDTKYVSSAYAAEGIVDAVAAVGADMIVMGTHGRRGLSRVALGSVAQEVLTLAPVPVLVAK